MPTPRKASLPVYVETGLSCTSSFAFSLSVWLMAPHRNDDDLEAFQRALPSPSVGAARSGLPTPPSTSKSFRSFIDRLATDTFLAVHGKYQLRRLTFISYALRLHLLSLQKFAAKSTLCLRATGQFAGPKNTDSLTPMACEKSGEIWIDAGKNSTPCLALHLNKAMLAILS